MDNTLVARGLVKRFSSVAVVHGVDLTLKPGEVTGYLGPNGSGKTVTVQMLTGLLQPSAGTIHYSGRDIFDDLIGFRRCLGYLPEEPHLYRYMSGRSYLELVGRLRGLPESLLRQKIDQLLEALGIDQAAEQPMSAYSKGMKQKVLISAALLHDPDVLILDEPESGLDVSAGLVLRHLIRALAEQGKAILYSSHVLDNVEKVCQRVVVIHRGQVVADDSVTRLRELMAMESLEEVFAQLVLKEDPAQIARDIAGVMSLRH
ncbi:MAG: ABC transporter ATP-binding protein [Vicinamibacterales bacterium]